jgi:hypothetical protein
MLLSEKRQLVLRFLFLNMSHKIRNVHWKINPVVHARRDISFERWGENNPRWKQVSGVSHLVLDNATDSDETGKGQ